MKSLLVIVLVQSLYLVVFMWFHRVAWVRILALRQQLTVYKRKAKKPRLRNRDRLFWSLLSKVWRDWASELILVRPETVIKWRKRKFREFWRKKSQGRSGRPAIPEEHIDFIRRIGSGRQGHNPVGESPTGASCPIQARSDTTAPGSNARFIAWSKRPGWVNRARHWRGLST